MARDAHRPLAGGPAVWLAAAVLAAGGAARAQQTPRIGYVYPAGGQRGTEFEIWVGGQYLNGVTGAYISGPGVRVQVTGYLKALTRQQLSALSMKVRELTALRRKKTAAKRGIPLEKLSMTGVIDPDNVYRAAALALGLDVDFGALEVLRERLANPKRQPNAQIEEVATLYITLADGAEPGLRELRLKTGRGVSNPLSFQVGQCKEYAEKEPNDKTPDRGIPDWLPVTVNGQVMPGDVDRFRFRATKGTRLVAAVSARRLIPYLADAVPGWFQATLKLSDARGNQIAYRDDFRFDPDPVIYYEVPADGDYILEIKDAIYRGREDFVYRITLGEVPFITNIFPLGGRAGAKTAVQVKGWNLPADRLTLEPRAAQPGILPVSVRRFNHVSNSVPFAVDTLPECLEKEPNNAPKAAQPVTPPVIVNARIDRPGDGDVFRFAGRAGQEIVAETHARRLGSPVDSLLRLTDAAGKQLAVNDDHVDKSAGLTTHHADSRLTVKLPADGSYLLHVGDTQHKGGPAYAYRLCIGPCRPDFVLRVVPSSISARAGATLPITAHALRKDGFTGGIALKLKGAPRGFFLSGGWIPPGQDKVRLTLTVSQAPQKRPVKLRMEGRAVIDGKEVRRLAEPAEDMTQAFVYRHLVPMEDWVVSVTGYRRSGRPVKVLGKGPVKLPVGGTAPVRLSGPGGRDADQVQIVLSEPPEGIAVKKVSPGARGMTILLAAEGGKAKPGLKGNLIVNAFVEREIKSKDGKPTGRKRRMSLGVLPAIPFEVVASAAADPARP